MRITVFNLLEAVKMNGLRTSKGPDNARNIAVAMKCQPMTASVFSVCEFHILPCLFIYILVFHYTGLQVSGPSLCSPPHCHLCFTMLGFFTGSHEFDNLHFMCVMTLQF